MKEANRYKELKLLLAAGEIANLELQKVFELVPKQPGERAVKYKSDFYYETREGLVVVEDTKGFKTKDYIIKRKLFKHIYKGIDFREI